MKTGFHALRLPKIFSVNLEKFRNSVLPFLDGITEFYGINGIGIRKFNLASALAALGLLLAGNTGAQAAEKVADFDAFRLLRTKNMFDPNRRPARTETASAPRPAPVRENKSSSLSLTGTMVTEGKTLAFFTGTRADYSKVLSVGDTIADCKITAIRPAEVEMERGGKPGVLAVGHQLQIEGAPSDVAAVEPAAAPATGAPPADPAAPASAGPTVAPAPSNDKSDVLRRMMERREKEMNK